MTAAAQRQFAVDVVQRLHDAGQQALWAGGCVRDLLLGISPKDYDVATSARPEQVREIFGRRRTQAVGASFGVILVRGPRDAGTIEVATFRTDGDYKDGRRPESVTFSTPEEDARRRDFTINGMFYDPLAERVDDYVGGQRDLSARVLRAIGDPHARIREDKLRLLRAVRFAATLEFKLDHLTAAAIRDSAAEIVVVSAERIGQELKRMLTDRHRSRAMQLAAELRLLQVIVPELADVIADESRWGVLLRTLQQGRGSEEGPGSSVEGPATEGGIEDRASSIEDRDSGGRGSRRAAGGTTDDAQDAESKTRDQGQRTKDNLKSPISNFKEEPSSFILHPASFSFAFATLLYDVCPLDDVKADAARAVCRRLRFSNDETDAVCWLLAHRHDLDDAPSAPAARLKRLMAHNLFGELLALVRARRAALGADLSPVEFCEDYLRRTSFEAIDPAPLLTGEDLIALGLKPGRAFKELLEIVRDAQLNGEIASKAEALQLIQRRIGAAG